MDMEPPHALQQTKKDIIASTEWERVIQELCTLLEQISGRQQLRDLEGLSEQEQHELMRQAAGQLQRTSTFKDLQSKVSSTLAQPDVIPSLVLLHIDDESQSAGTRDESCLNPPSSKLGSEHAVKSCAYLLQEHHHLKHYLKKCFNHPLPAELRRAAWKTLLQYASLAVRQEKPRRYSITRFKEECKEDREISRKCESTLQSSPFFSQLARSSVIMEAMKSIMAFWSRQHPDGQLSEADFLLCIPFLCTWQSKLEREDRAPGISIRHVKQVQALLTDIAEVYVSFMEEAHVKVVKAVDQTAQEVEDLLSAESPTLYKHLVEILGSKFKDDHDTHSQFHVRLKKIIYVHLQRMFVGDLPMEVVCYIWDQCFIGATISGFQCLKYFAASWFIILKHQLLVCQSEEDVKQILVGKHYKLKIEQFQSQIDRRFLGQISSWLKITPFQTKAPVSKKHEKMVSTILYPMRSSPPLPAHASRKQQESAPIRVSSQKHVKDTNLKEKPKLEVESDLLEQERKKHKKELEELTLEVELLRRKVEGLSKQPKSRVVPSKAVSSGSTMSTIPSDSTLFKYDSSAHHQHASSQRLVSSSKAIAVDRPSQTQEIPLEPSITSTQKYRPFSPGNLTRDDVTNIWFMIFQRFTSAVNFIFHGNGKHQLDTSSQQQSESLIQEKGIQDQ